VDAAGLPALPFGDSDEIRVGDWVVAIGNPFGLEHTVSAGIISAKERTGRDVQLGDPDAYYSFLQTDASINPGNSGGPLLDLNGRVVGINTAINQSANNIGFAIPVNMIRELLPRLLSDGIVKRAAIGVQVADVSLDDVKRWGLLSRDGAIVAQVVPRSPAEAAGMRAGDVVISFDGKPVRTPEDLRWRASLAVIGKGVPLEVLRGAQKLSLTIEPAPLRVR
jgi:serine protease Do